MEKRVISRDLVAAFAEYLRAEEKQPATIEKYLRDVKRFCDHAKGRPVDKLTVLEYKTLLEGEYAVTSANSMLAALNIFLEFAGWHDCRVKPFKLQKQIYCPEDKELSRSEYFRLVDAAGRKGDERLSLILQTICGTGIRVSELKFITVEAVKNGEAEVRCKGKNRRIFLVQALRKKLMVYIRKCHISSGPVFITKTGHPVCRTNIWRQMKNLCQLAGVSASKVFPHNLRHLFARAFYKQEKDIIKLADVLGHANINTTRIYTVTTGEEHRRKMESLRLIL